MQYHQAPLQAYQAYMRSDSWKCKESSSGAHHWIEDKTLYKDHSVFKCADCGEERQLSNCYQSNFRPVKCLEPLT